MNIVPRRVGEWAAVPQGLPDGGARGCFAPGRSGRRALVSITSDFATALAKPVPMSGESRSAYRKPSHTPRT